MDEYFELAQWYDVLVGEWDESVNRHCLWLRDLVEVTNEGAIDVACGTGIYTAALSKLGIRAVGVDISPRMLSVARRPLLGCVPRPEFVLGSWEALPIQTGTNRTVTCGGNALAHCLSDDTLIQVLQELARVAGDGAIVLDVRHPSSVSRTRTHRFRGQGEIGGRAFELYDLCDHVTEDEYRMTIIKRDVPGGLEVEDRPVAVFHYRTDPGSAILRLAASSNLAVVHFREIDELGERFLLMVLKRPK